MPDITELIPQRAPILMVDALLRADATGAETAFRIPAAHRFLDDDGCLTEVALIEHIAQSASAQAGYMTWQAGATVPPVGMIGEVKKFRCLRRPAVGEMLRTTITMGPEVEGVTLISGETRVGEEVVATTKMKIFVER